MSSKNKPCYKCGQGGHWAKDCTTPRERWISKEASEALRPREDAAATTTTTDDAARADGGDDDERRSRETRGEAEVERWDDATTEV